MNMLVSFAVRSWRVAAVLWRFARQHCPKWALPLLVVCAFIPGPADELILAAVVAWPVLRSAESRRELVRVVRDAWTP
jgi:hypothetical protein